ncbi:protein O9 [Cercopithecine betaherpesvirus 5]|uniref:Protein O9 n=1 Tax=Simian cytomegalovirus (strain Colburn) TaxID=50292 RepID=G8XTS3_SCMVC|nr:protein O9 [Cercopithecine betaherpesvirus 5]
MRTESARRIEFQNGSEAWLAPDFPEMASPDRTATILIVIGLMLIFLIWGMRIPHTFFRQLRRQGDL